MEVRNEPKGNDRYFIDKTELRNTIDSDGRVFGKLRGMLG